MAFFPVAGLLEHPTLEIPFTGSIRFTFHVGKNGRKTAVKEQGEKRSKEAKLKYVNRVVAQKLVNNTPPKKRGKKKKKKGRRQRTIFACPFSACIMDLWKKYGGPNPNLKVSKHQHFFSGNSNP